MLSSQKNTNLSSKLRLRMLFMHCVVGTHKKMCPVPAGAGPRETLLTHARQRTHTRWGETKEHYSLFYYEQPGSVQR